MLLIVAAGGMAPHRAVLAYESPVAVAPPAAAALPGAPEVVPPVAVTGPAAALRDAVELAPLPSRSTQRQRWQLVVQFYRRRNYDPAWSDGTVPSPDAAELVQAVKTAAQHGLDPEDYGVTEMAAHLARNAETTDTAVAIDLPLTLLFFNFAGDLLNGHAAGPGAFPPKDFPPKDIDLVNLLEGALADHRIADALRQVTPQHTAYAKLQAALTTYRALADKGGWPSIADGPTLRPRDTGPRVAALRARLIATGELEPAPVRQVTKKDKRRPPPPPGYDSKVAEAVRRFQKRHGLPPDGNVGAQTLAALNVPIRDRIQQLELTLERWRWLPRQLGHRYIWVNIPSYELRVIESDAGAAENGTDGHGTTAVRLKAIVGDNDHPTPSLGASMTHLVLNPYWNIPQSIALNEIIPAAASDPSYLQKKNIKVLRGSGPDRREIDPRRIKWSRLSGNPDFRFRQEPGPQNSLGRIKFVFPNPFGVYLHDTPGRHLFGKQRRLFSHGCIRIEHANDLANYLLEDSGRWHKEQIEEALATQRMKTIVLPQPIPVYLTYFTAWVDEDGELQFRDDVYGEDPTLEEALRTRTGSPLRSASE